MSFRIGATTAGNFFDPGNCLATCIRDPKHAQRNNPVTKRGEIKPMSDANGGGVDEFDGVPA